MECFFTRDYGKADYVALGVNLHLETVPEIIAEVFWGEPSGCVEATFSDKLMKVSDDVLEDLYKDLPRLYGALFGALKRRKPPDE
jgi:hypothetical protein